MLLTSLTRTRQRPDVALVALSPFSPFVPCSPAGPPERPAPPDPLTQTVWRRSARRTSRTLDGLFAVLVALAAVVAVGGSAANAAPHRPRSTPPPPPPPNAMADEDPSHDLLLTVDSPKSKIPPSQRRADQVKAGNRSPSTHPVGATTSRWPAYDRRFRSPAFPAASTVEGKRQRGGSRTRAPPPFSCAANVCQVPSRPRRAGAQARRRRVTSAAQPLGRSSRAAGRRRPPSPLASQPSAGSRADGLCPPCRTRSAAGRRGLTVLVEVGPSKSMRLPVGANPGGARVRCLWRCPSSRRPPWAGRARCRARRPLELQFGDARQTDSRNCVRRRGRASSLATPNRRRRCPRS